MDTNKHVFDLHKKCTFVCVCLCPCVLTSLNILDKWELCTNILSAYIYIFHNMHAFYYKCK